MTFWGIVALVFGVIAILGSNVSTILPENLMTGLHSTRLEGGNLNNLRAQVSELQNQAIRIRTENNKLSRLLKLSEQDRGDVTRRVGAIENSLPELFVSNAEAQAIDRNAITSAVKKSDDTNIINVPGGSVAITQTPIGGVQAPEITAPEQAVEMPPALSTNPTKRIRVVSPTPLAFGIALGPEVTVQDAFVAWQDITRKVGPLLLGLGPVLSGNAGLEQQRLIAGPIDDYAQAEQLCTRMIRVGISCLPVPYAGKSLPQ